MLKFGKSKNKYDICAEIIDTNVESEGEVWFRPCRFLTKTEAKSLIYNY